MEFISDKHGSTPALLSSLRKVVGSDSHRAFTMVVVLALIACYCVAEMAGAEGLLVAAAKSLPALFLAASIQISLGCEPGS